MLASSVPSCIDGGSMDDRLSNYHPGWEGQNECHMSCEGESLIVDTEVDRMLDTILMKMNVHII